MVETIRLILAWFLCVVLIFFGVYTYEENKKIQNLDNEIKELKRMKGE